MLATGFGKLPLTTTTFITAANFIADNKFRGMRHLYGKILVSLLISNIECTYLTVTSTSPAPLSPSMTSAGKPRSVTARASCAGPTPGCIGSKVTSALAAISATSTECTPARSRGQWVGACFEITGYTFVLLVVWWLRKCLPIQ